MCWCVGYAIPFRIGCVVGQLTCAMHRQLDNKNRSVEHPYPYAAKFYYCWCYWLTNNVVCTYCRLAIVQLTSQPVFSYVRLCVLWLVTECKYVWIVCYHPNVNKKTSSSIAHVAEMFCLSTSRSINQLVIVEIVGRSVISSMFLFLSSATRRIVRIVKLSS